MEQDLKKKKKLLIMGIVSTIVILLGSAYAFFTYFKSSEAFSITSSFITAKFTAGTNSVTFMNAYPISDSFAMSNLDKLTYIDFTVSSDVASENQSVEYEIFLTEDLENTLDSSFVKVYLTNYDNPVISPLSYSSLENTTYSGAPDGKVVYRDTNSGKFAKNYRLYVWLDSSYEQNEVNQTFSFKVNLYAYNANAVEKPKLLVDNFMASLIARPNTYIEEDGIYYVSGAKDDEDASTTDDIDFNYVWYSGKLWRITTINEDGTMKMITEKPITTIAFGEDYKFYTNESTSSWIYQWLNEDFLDTLYNYENIINTNSKWNVTTEDGNLSTKLAETTMVPAKAGLFNSYEYYKSYEKLGTEGYENGYLNIGYEWWLSNRCLWAICFVEHDGKSNSGASNNSDFGIRPSINIKSTIELRGGTGTKSDPYTLKLDKDDAVANTTLLITRSSGEYVNFDGELYRIVGIENNTTKLNKVDYIKDENEQVVEKKFSSSVTYGSGTDDTYWDYYLSSESSTTSWYNDISSNYKSMLEKGTYYLGTVSSAGNYKLSICATASNTVTTKDCAKTSATYSGYVGLPRYGEMFASQLGNGESEANEMWLITPLNSSSVISVSTNGNGNNSSPSVTYGSRPSINLKSTIKITSGNGTISSPFEIGLPS